MLAKLGNFPGIEYLKKNKDLSIIVQEEQKKIPPIKIILGIAKSYLKTLTNAWPEYENDIDFYAVAEDFLDNCKNSSLKPFTLEELKNFLQNSMENSLNTVKQKIIVAK